MLRILKIYVLPGAVLQSVIIGGGYGTGRELVEFFTRHGIANGLLGQILATVLMSGVFALTLAIAVRYETYDYRSFFKLLLGRGWFLFEILLIMLIVLVLAVIGSAAGGILNDNLGLPERAGAIVMLIAVTVLTFFGREWVTRFLASWSVLLYLVFIVYFVVVISGLEPADWEGKLNWTVESSWMVSGLQYALYNITGVPIILYAARAIETQRQAISSGLIGGLIAMFPAILFHMSFIGAYPGILSEALPVYSIFASLSLPILYACFLVILFGTFIETGAGDMQGIVERLDTWWSERTGAKLNRTHHALFAICAMAIAGVLAEFGIVDLIAEGYGTIAWGFLFVYLIPLLTVGVYRLRQ